LEGDDIGELDKAMQRVSYLNSRQFPTPGIRRLKITSTVKYVPVFTVSIYGQIRESIPGGAAICPFWVLEESRGVCLCKPLACERALEALTLPAYFLPQVF
jgi:hypothetical protein